MSVFVEGRQIDTVLLTRPWTEEDEAKAVKKERSFVRKAERGSKMLLEALCKAQGIEPPADELPPPPPEPKKVPARIPDRIIIKPTVIREPSSPILNIQRAVASYYELPPTAMVSAQRGYHIAHPRQLAMYLASELTTKSLVEIGMRFGGRDHTTVIHAIKAVKKRAANDPSLAEDVRFLREALAG